MTEQVQVDRAIDVLRRQEVDRLHRRRCPVCDSPGVAPCQFGSGVWGLRCRTCGEPSVVARWAALVRPANEVP